ncbi:MAG: SpoIID/LytB domain-containing protein [Chlamydiota bacterium]
MFRKITFLLIVLTASLTSLEAGVWHKIKGLWGDGSSPEPTIKVLLADDVDGAMLEVRGAYNIIDPRNGNRLGTRLIGKANFVHPLPAGLKWGEKFPAIYQFEIVPDNKTTTTLVNGTQYLGNIRVFQIGEKISIVNEVPIEEYLKSTLSPQFEEPLPDEVANAIAIAARTEAYYIASMAPKAYWQVQADQVDYQGYAVTHNGNGLDKAVDETRYFVMQSDAKDNDSHFFAARWTDHSAGKTAPFHLIFRHEGGALQEGVEVPVAALNREDSEWSYKTTKAELESLTHSGRLKEIELYTDPQSKKVYNVRLVEEQGDEDYDFLSFQHLLGVDRLQSSDFNVDIEGEKVIFNGYGKGPGVGICLYAAQNMSNNGEDAASILMTFFPEARIVKARS